MVPADKTVTHSLRILVASGHNMNETTEKGLD